MSELNPNPSPNQQVDRTELKTETERMLSNELYLASDPVLIAGRQRARRLTQEFNSLQEDQTERRSQILQELFAHIGQDVFITPPFYCDYGCYTFLGDRVYMNFGCVILDCNEVHIGDDVLMAPYVQIYTAYHPTDPQTRLSGRELAAPIRIGNNVWLGGNAIVCPGVTIGENTTIGAGSVVTKDIPANVIAVGNPCRVIREVGGGE